MISLRQSFATRDALAHYLREAFPQAAERGANLSPIQGGRRAAEALIERIQPKEYAATRNMLNGAVTHLSPYLRHGVVTLAELRTYILQNNSVQNSYKFLQELAWRDYFQRVYARLGNDIWSNIEPYKTGISHYEKELPEDIEQGKTGAMCIDSFAHDLHKVGYLHNHARMWTAAYVVHHRRVRWQAGAFWFLQHLLDGDPASNNLSWQWVASTFAAKPYFFNRENLARYTDNAYCRTCPLAQRGCPFEGSYEDVTQRLFPAEASNVETPPPTRTALSTRLMNSNGQITPIDTETIAIQPVLVWVNEESLDPFGPGLAAHPQAARIFIFDEATIEKAQWSLKRIAFIYECLLEIPNIQIYRGAAATILTSLCKEYGYKTIVTTPVVDPRLKQSIATLEKVVEVKQYPIEAFVYGEHIRDLRRFSRYWHQVQGVVVGDQNILQ